MIDEPSQKKIDEVWQLFRETAARFKETDARLDQRFEETAQRFRETDTRLDQRFRETDEQLRRLEGIFGIQWGRMIEALVTPAALQLFRARGIDVHSSHERQKSRVNGRHIELDIVLENDAESVVIEVKSRMRVRDVDDFLDDLSHLDEFFSRFDGRRVYAAVAAIEYVEDADKYAYRQGLFVLGFSGEGLVQMRNDDRFQPADFGPRAAGESMGLCS